MVCIGYTTVEVKQDVMDRFREAVYQYHGANSHGQIKKEIEIALRHRIETLYQNGKIDKHLENRNKTE